SSLLPLVFVIPALFSPLLNQRSRKAAYRRNTSLHGPRSVVVDEQGLSFKGPNFSSQVNWPIFVKFAEDGKVVVLFQSSHVFHIIPKRQLSPQQISSLRDAITRHIPTRDRT
ncbi:MAG TPA: YcxB family protein, partial [Candidatus Angelobacter sp.]|nr:YcxB family protein [Candidatus Angelobacter sp.]